MTTYMNIRRRLLFALVLAIAIFGLAGRTFAKCGDPGSPLAALVPAGRDDGKRIPLILIHGNHGTSPDEPINKDSGSWQAFEELFREPSSKLTDVYALYLFQYCSDRENVASIAVKLRDLIDAKLRDRPNVIVTHSMGGIIATSYMTDTAHKTGGWKGRTGGETTLGLITLAAPHHGSPTANDPGTVKKFIPDKFEILYTAIVNAYWRSSLGEDHPGVKNSTIVNRSDLRWDNYDGRLDNGSKDINTVLAKRNRLLERYSGKVIAYAGSLEAKLSPMDMVLMLLELKENGDNLRDDDHKLLTFANIGMAFGLDHTFGDADGLVPLSSGLLCKDKVGGNEPAGSKSNMVCKTMSRVRRFESGSGDGELPVSEYPDEKTLSIYRTRRGFDHLDMLMSPVVLGYVVKDLLAFASMPLQTVKSTIKSG